MTTATANTYTGSVDALLVHTDGISADMSLLKNVSYPLTASWCCGIDYGCCGRNQCCEDYVPNFEPEVVIGNEEDHVAVLENNNLSVRFFLDKKLSLAQRVVYKLAGFRYEVNKES